MTGLLNYTDIIEAF